MPNLVPPVRNVEEAQLYRQRILAEREPGSVFEPLMVLYLTDQTSADDIRAAAQPGSGCFAAKLYPAGATTNSESGVTRIDALDGVFQAMQECGMPLLVHGEVTHDEVDVFDREARFIDEVLTPLLERHPRLKVVLEHISTAQSVEFVRQAPDNIAATITAHHLMFNRNHLLAGNVRPHYYCLPILKRASHQKALLEAAVSGNPKFFLGTDSAPHPVSSKEAACGCAGCYTAHAAIEMYAEVFEQQQALDKLEAFASFYGPDFYGLPRNTDTITLIRESWQVPEQMEFGSQTLRPLKYGEQIAWQVVNESSS